jgi:hypothetical protein
MNANTTHKSAIVAALAANSESGNGEPDNVSLPKFIESWVEGQIEGWEVVHLMPTMLPEGEWLVLATGIGHDCIADFGNWVTEYCPAEEFLPETPDTLIREYTPPGWHDAGGREVAALSLYRSKHPDFIAFVDRYTDEWDIVTWLYRA